MCDVDRVVRIHQQADKVIHLLLIGFIDFFKRGKLRRVARMRADLNVSVPAVVQGEFEGTAHVEECGVVPAVRLPRFLGFHAADDVVSTGVFQRKASRHQCGNNHLVVVIGGQADACARQFRRLN